MEARQQWRASARADNAAADPGSTPHSSAHPLPVCVLSPGFISWGGGGHGLSCCSCLAVFLHADVGPRRQRRQSLVCVETARGRGDEDGGDNLALGSCWRPRRHQANGSRVTAFFSPSSQRNTFTSHTGPVPVTV